MKKIVKIIVAQFSEFWKNERAFIVILMGAAFACYFNSQFLRFANTMSLALNPVECYIINGSSRRSFTCIILFGVLLLTFDVPYFSDRSIFEISRVGKRQWLVSKTLFLFLEIFLYNLFIFAVTIALSLFSTNSLVWDAWSPAMKHLTMSGTVGMNTFDLYFPYREFTAALSPWMATWITFLFNSAYCLVLVLIMMDCNILLGGTKGWPIGVGIHILGYVVSNNGHGVLFRYAFSLLDCAFPAHQFSSTSSSEVFFSGIIFFIVIIELLLPVKWLGKRLVL